VKTDLDHLPLAKREPIQRVVEIVRDGTAVEMVVLFGSYARGDWVDDPVNAYFSDVDFLVVVATDQLAEDGVLWARLTDQARKVTGRALVSFIVHTVHEINHEIRRGQYFFSEIISQGVLLFDSRRFTLAAPKALTARERRELAEHSFRYWFDSASGFWRGVSHLPNHEPGPARRLPATPGRRALLPTPSCWSSPATSPRPTTSRPWPSKPPPCTRRCPAPFRAPTAKTSACSTS